MANSQRPERPVTPPPTFNDNADLGMRFTYMTLGSSDYSDIAKAKQAADAKISDFTIRVLDPQVTAFESINKELKGDVELKELIFDNHPENRVLFSALEDGEVKIKEAILANIAMLKEREDKMLELIEETKRNYGEMKNHTQAQFGALLQTITPTMVQFFTTDNGITLELPKEVKRRLSIDEGSEAIPQVTFLTYLTNKYQNNPAQLYKKITEISQLKGMTPFTTALKDALALSPSGFKKTWTGGVAVNAQEWQAEINKKRDADIGVHRHNFIMAIEEMTRNSQNINEYATNLRKFREVLETERMRKNLKNTIELELAHIEAVVQPTITKCEESVIIYAQCQKILPELKPLSSLTGNIKSFMEEARVINTNINRITKKLTECATAIMDSRTFSTVKSLEVFNEKKIQAAIKNYEIEKEALMIKASTIVNTAEEAMKKIDHIALNLNNIYHKFSSILLENEKLWQNKLTGKSVNVGGKTIKVPNRISKMIKALQGNNEPLKVDERLQAIFTAFASDERKPGFFTNISRSKVTDELYSIIRFAQDKNLYDVDVLREINGKLNTFLESHDKKHKTHETFVAQQSRPKIPLINPKVEIELMSPDEQKEFPQRKHGRRRGG